MRVLHIPTATTYEARGYLKHEFHRLGRLRWVFADIGVNQLFSSTHPPDCDVNIRCILNQRNIDRSDPDVADSQYLYARLYEFSIMCDE